MNVNTEKSGVICTIYYKYCTVCICTCTVLYICTCTVVRGFGKQEEKNQTHAFGRALTITKVSNLQHI